MKKIDGRGKHGRQGRKPKYNEPSKKMTIRFPESMVEVLKDEAKKQGIGFASHVVEICKARKSL